MDKNKISILLCTYNGEKFLPKQIESIIAQTYENWQLFISDDGSSDNTLKIINGFVKRYPNKIKMVSGPKNGFAENFKQITLNKNIYSPFYAWSDQDDIWEKNKLEIAFKFLKKCNAKTPSMFCSRTTIIDSEDFQIRKSKKFNKKPTFQNALVQCIAGGNTMVFNHAAKIKFGKASLDTKIVSHDWLMYLVVTGVGGNVHYEKYPTVFYREHNLNIVGSNNTLIGAAKRLLRLMQGEYFFSISLNLRAINNIQMCLTNTNKKTYRSFIKMRKVGSHARIICARKMGIYRQEKIENIALFISILFNKI